MAHAAALGKKRGRLRCALVNRRVCLAAHRWPTAARVGFLHLAQHVPSRHVARVVRPRCARHSHRLDACPGFRHKLQFAP